MQVDVTANYWPLHQPAWKKTMSFHCSAAIWRMKITSLRVETKKTQFHNSNVSLRDSESGFRRWCCPSVCLFVCLFVFCLFVAKIRKKRFLQKLSNVQLWSLLTTNSPRKSYMGYSKTHSWTPKIQDSGHPPSWKSLNGHISTTYHLIMMNFDIQQQIWNPTAVTRPNMIFKIQEDERPPYWKSFWL